MRLALAGLATGLVLSLAATRIVSIAALRDRHTDPAVLTGSCRRWQPLPCWPAPSPARRAARVDPMISLRYQ